MIASVDKGVDPGDIDALYLGNFTTTSSWVSPTGRDHRRCGGPGAQAGHPHRRGLRLQRHSVQGRGLRHRIRFYDMVLVAGVEDMSKRSTAEVAEGLAVAAVPYERKSGFTFPGVFGAIATAYFERYGAGREHLMNVTIKSHDNAPLNPRAQYRVSVGDIMAARAARAKSRGKRRRSGRTRRTSSAIPG